MIKLGVNVDHVATLRQARYRHHRLRGEPDPVTAAQIAIAAGAHGITAHLREDRRHIQDHDIERLRQTIDVCFNFEMATTPEMIGLAQRTKPEIVCLVPEKREEVTTEGGLNVAGALDTIRDTVQALNDAGIDVSLFIDPDARQVEAASKTGAQFIELHTGAFAESFADQKGVDEALEVLHQSATAAHQSGLRVNAGHGLNYHNTASILNLPHLEELNIGHSIVSRAIETGMQTAVTQMLRILATPPSPPSP